MCSGHRGIDAESGLGLLVQWREILKLQDTKTKIVRLSPCFWLCNILVSIASYLYEEPYLVGWSKYVDVFTRDRWVSTRNQYRILILPHLAFLVSKGYLVLGNEEQQHNNSLKKNRTEWCEETKLGLNFCKFMQSILHSCLFLSVLSVMSACLFLSGLLCCVSC